ncbi:isochorismatase family protein [Aquiflexum lacus]|uniref:isochorismatase family protein n=1 Tax=Aquiflexum lacus TaxID=2483805 RepID=UPI0018936EE2|nr:isochorismatase family protein [Aquiflexum lacus]
MSRYDTENTVFLLIDHQVGTIKLARNISHEQLIKNARALARTAIECGIPLILTTSNENNFQGPLINDFLDIAPKEYETRVKRTGMVNAWEYAEFKNAVLATGKKNIVLAGLTNDVCTVFPAISAVEEGYQVQVVVDAGGSPTQLADETALRRMEKHGVILTSTNQLMAEIANDWSTDKGRIILNIMYQEILVNLIN